MAATTGRGAQPGLAPPTREQVPQGAVQASTTRSPRAMPVDARHRTTLHDTRAFVTQDHIDRPRPVAVHHMQVGVANAGSDHAHPDLAGTGRVEPQSFDGQRSAGTA